MNTKEQTSFARKALYGMMMVAVFFVTFGGGSLQSVYAQVDNNTEIITATKIAINASNYEIGPNKIYIVGIAEPWAVTVIWRDGDEVGEPIYTLVYKSKAGWAAVLPENSKLYNQYLQDIPDTLIDKTTKIYLKQPEQTFSPSPLGAYTGYYLPWQYGEKATVTTSPTTSKHANQIDYNIWVGTNRYADGNIAAAKDGNVVYYKDSSNVQCEWDTTNNRYEYPGTSTPCPWTEANLLVIKHADNLYSWYLHLKQGSIPSEFKHANAAVKHGNIIGQEGTTGWSSGVHLHFMVTTDYTIGTSGMPWGNNPVSVDFTNGSQTLYYTDMGNGTEHISQNSNGGGGGGNNPPSGFTWCADEDGRCNFGGTADVVYGAVNSFTSPRSFTNGTDCNNSVFGDPINGTKKACYYKQTAPPTGNLHIEYFNDKNLGGRCYDSYENSTYVFKNWGSGSPASGCNSDNFSARFTGTYNFSGGDYSFHCQHDDGCRIYIDGQLKIDAWWDSPFSGHDWGGQLSGNHEVKIEFNDSGGDARIEAFWSGNGFLPNGSSCIPSEWCAQYYGNKDFSGTPAISRNEGNTNINYDWGDGSIGYGFPVDNFSARWQRNVYFAAGVYRFHIRTDDGGRLSVNNNQVINQWKDQGVTEYTADVTLSDGEIPVKFEYYENGGGAIAQMWWETLTLYVDDATFVTQSTFPTVNPGQNYQIYFEVKNTGNTAWQVGSYWLQNLQNPLGANAQQLLSQSVGPNGVYRWTINQTAPTTPGTYRSQWMVSHNGITFGPNMYIDVTVQGNPPPGDFNKTGPSNNSTGQSTSPSLAWSSSNGATDYEYCIDITNDNTCSTWIPNGTNTSITLSGLSAGTTYYWQVRSINNGGITYANTNSWWSFTTEPAPIVNLLANAGFEEGSTLPTNWSKDAWTMSYSTFTWGTVFHSGARSVKITNNTANDARWIQTVKVQPNSDYRLSGWIKTQNVSHSLEVNDYGANLSTLSPFWTNSGGLFGTNDWTYVSYEFNTGSNTQITVAARLGMYSGTNKGTAWFDDLSLELLSPPLCFDLTTAASPIELGSISANPAPNCNGTQYAYDTVVELTAMPNTGYFFTSWSGDATGSTNPVSITMTSDKSVTAMFSDKSTLTITLNSTAAYDGFLVESSETSNQGQGINNALTTFYVGDDADNRQYRGMLSFATGDLPDNAVITKVTLKIRKSGLFGTNPFITHSGLLFDIRKGYFGTAASLVATDFQAVSSLAAAGKFNATPVDNWYSVQFSANAMNYINKTGATQIRLRFSKDDNNDWSADYIKFFSGNYTLNPDYKPQLIIEYYIP